ncbi:polysaccharide deacetylase family protein [Streptomyces sp. NPDC001312]|uniref:polysaccharide deacetylase family protein n=1 Tax=Streptomyces sp. NPDC001312 TaxID=3364561 RepID=UPI0036CF9D05
MATYVYTAPYDTVYTNIPLTAGPKRGAGGTPTVWDWDATPPTDGRWKPTASAANQTADNGGSIGSVSSPLVASGDAILSGHGNPPAGLGRDGQYWVDIDSNTLWGPRLSGQWPSTGVALAGGLPKSGGTISGDLAVTGRLTASSWGLPLLAPAPARTAWRPSSYIQNFQAGHGWTVTNVGSSNLNDTSQFVRGTQCATITTSGAGANGNLSRYGQSAFNLTGKAIRLILKIDDITHVSSVNFFVGTSSLNHYFKWKLHNVTASSSMIQSGEWVTVTAQWADVNSALGSYSISSNGAPSTTTGFTDMMFQVVDDASGQVTAHLQSVEIIDDTSTAFPNGVVSITFDDSWHSVHDYARPEMDKYGYRGTTYTIADYIGTSGRLSLAELRSVQDLSGWEVAGHSYTGDAHGTRYVNLTAQKVDDELRNLKAWLVTNEFTSDAFAYPGGQFGKTTDGVPVDQLVGRYFNSGRSINYLNTTELFPAAMPKRMRALSSISGVISVSDPANVTKLTSAGGMLDRCQRNGSWLILTFHQIVTGTEADPTQCSVANFQTVMAAINARGIPVLPVGDVLRIYS